MEPEQKQWGANESIDMVATTMAELRKAGGVDRLGMATSLLLLSTAVSQLDGIAQALIAVERYAS